MLEEDDSDRYRAPALDKGLDILELLSGIDGGLTQAEIAKHLGRSPNEFYRMLDRLVRRGYVTRLEGDRYSLTLKLFGLAQLHAPVRRLASYATPLMRDRSRPLASPPAIAAARVQPVPWSWVVASRGPSKRVTDVPSNKRSVLRLVCP